MTMRILIQNQLRIARPKINLAKYSCSSTLPNNNGPKHRESQVKNEFYNWKKNLHATMKVHHNFISESEEKSLLDEVLPYVEKLHYEYAHWDDMIHGYRETEFLKWNQENNKIIDRIREKAFPPGMPQLSLVHVLDLAENGFIKPHVDSTRFCGDIIAGISLLSGSVMRLTYVGHENEYFDNFFLPRRSMYIMKGIARQKYKHEILSNAESIWNGRIIKKTRRISIICRCQPEPIVKLGNS